MARMSTHDERANFVARQKGFEPVITQERYVTDMLYYLNYHNRMTDMRVIRKWALALVEGQSADRQKALDRASDFELRSIGVVAHAETRGYFVSPEHSTKIRLSVQRLIEKYSAAPAKAVAVAAPTTPAPVVDVELSEFRKHKAEVDAAIDEFTKTATAFSMRGYLAMHSVKKAVVKRLGESFVPLLDELRAALDGKDADLKEGYSHLGKIRLRHLVAMVQLIISDCAQAVLAAKAPRKPRAKKEKPASVLVSKLKYAKEFAELNLKSELPTALVGASVVWLYDTARRKVSVYEAADGEKISVKGTTLIGWDVTKSSCKTLRKPAEFVAGNLAKRSIAATYKGLKTKEATVNGRTNENIIILKVF